MNTKSMTFGRRLSLGTIMALFLTAFALQGLSADDKDAKHGQFSKDDYKFVSEAAEGGMMEVALGQMALQKSSNNSVKQFGQRMVDEHGKINDDLKQLVSTKGAALPDPADKKHEKVKEKLMDKTGADFDKAYIKAMVSDHKKDIKVFEKYAEKADDAELKAFINKALPFMKEHLRVAEAIESAIDKAPSQTKADGPAVAEK